MREMKNLKRLGNVYEDVVVSIRCFPPKTIKIGKKGFSKLSVDEKCLSYTFVISKSLTPKQHLVKLK